MSIFAAIFVISGLASFYAWFLIILFTKRVKNLNTETKIMHSFIMAILGSTSELNLVLYIKK
jgi:hypothetical protein